MPLSRYNQRTFHRTLYSGQLEKVRLLKRGDDQRQGTVTAYVLFECRRSPITKTGETLDGDMTVGYETTWHIPRIELDRVGVHYLNPADRIVELEGDDIGRTWAPLADTEIEVKLTGQHLCIHCQLLEPRA